MKYRLVKNGHGEYRIEELDMLSNVPGDFTHRWWPVKFIRKGSNAEYEFNLFLKNKKEESEYHKLRDERTVIREEDIK